MMRKLFYCVLLLSLSSCTGCMDRLKESTREKTAYRDQFHFAPIDYRKEGVNTEHLFSFTETSMEYNGKLFSIHIPMDTIFKVFGPYSRMICDEGQSSGYRSYFWDNIGLVIVSSPEHIAISIEIHWDYLPPEPAGNEADDREDIPQGFFQGKILLNGIPLDNTSDIAAFCKNKEMNKEIKRLWRRVRPGRYFWECGYQFPEKCYFFRYNLLFHKLYLYDYTQFPDHPFFGYVLKMDDKTAKMHSFGVGYEVYSRRLKYSPIL